MAYQTDNFDGTGAINTSRWDLTHNPTRAPTPSRVSGELHWPFGIGDNVNNEAAFFDDGVNYFGRPCVQEVDIPASGTEYIYFIGVGVGDDGTPSNNLASNGTGDYRFGGAGVFQSKADTSAYEFFVFGPRNGNITGEGKRRPDNDNSVQNEIGARNNANDTKGNIRIGIKSDGTLEWAYQDEGDDPNVDPWTDITMPTNGTTVTGPIVFTGSVFVGFITYSFNGTLVSGEEFTGVLDRTYSSAEAADSPITYSRAYTRMGPHGIMMPALPEPDVDNPVTFNRAYTRMGPHGVMMPSNNPLDVTGPSITLALRGG